MKRIWIDRPSLEHIRIPDSDPRPIVVDIDGQRRHLRSLSILGPCRVVTVKQKPAPDATVSVWIETDSPVEGE